MSQYYAHLSVMSSTDGPPSGHACDRGTLLWQRYKLQISWTPPLWSAAVGAAAATARRCIKELRACVNVRSTLRKDEAKISFPEKGAQLQLTAQHPSALVNPQQHHHSTMTV
jgi:hypothetical protein